MEKLYIGIDLATTYCAVAHIAESSNVPVIIKNSLGNDLTPSVICFEEDGSYYCGDEAKDELKCGNLNCASVFKRNIGTLEKNYQFFDREYSAGDLSALLLNHIRAEVEKKFGRPIDGAVITVPAYFEDIQRRETITACMNAGIPFMGLLDEPIAAALTFGKDTWKENSKFMVYDLGGGTFDVTIVQMGSRGMMKVLTTNGDHQLGGVDWDRCLLAVVCDRIEEATGMHLNDDIDFAADNFEQLEETKIRLSGLTNVPMSFQVPGAGTVKVMITREAFEERCVTLVQRTIGFCESMLHSKGLHWQDIDDVLLVGGSTRMPMIKAALQAKYGKKPLESLNPDLAVAFGAAIQAKLLANMAIDEVSMSVPQGKGLLARLGQGRKKQSATAPAPVIDTEIGLATVVRAVPHSMGVIAVSEDGTRYVNRIILRKDEKSPCSKAEMFRFRTRSGRKNPLDIYVTQGEDENNPLANNIYALYTADIPHTTSDGRVNVCVMYSYDENGVSDVAVRLENGDKDLPIRRAANPGDTNKFGLPPEKTEVAEPVYLMLTLDVSGSMSGPPIEAAKREMVKFVDQLSSQLEEVYFSITVVSDANQEITSGFTSNVREAKRAIDMIFCGMTGYGNSAHPFTMASKKFEPIEGRKIQVVLADGVWSNQPEAVNRAKDCHRNGIEICGMGFGQADRQFLKDISSMDQMSIYTASYSGLGAAFGSIAQVISNSSSTGGGLFGGHKNESGRKEIEPWVSDVTVNYQNSYEDKGDDVTTNH